MDQTGCHPPEGYTLVKTNELNRMKKLLKEVGTVSVRISDINAGARGYNMPDRANLVSAFENVCLQHNGSTLRSKIEDTKSQCTLTLKSNLKEIQKKQNKSKKALKERFENGGADLKQSYHSQLLACFENQSMPVEMYCCEELLKTYRNCLKTQLLPQMNNMYRDHCNKIDAALKDWVRQYRTVTGAKDVSPAVADKINNLQRRINDMSQKAQHNPPFHRQINTVLQRVTEEVDRMTVERREATREATPAEKVEESLECGDFLNALNQALVAMDLELLLSTCNKITVEDVFGDSAPSQPILLALVNQLSHNLDQDLEVKSQFLLEAVQGLDLTDPVIINNRDTVYSELEKLITQIDHTKTTLTPRQFNQNLKQLRWASNQIIRQLQEF